MCDDNDFAEWDKKLAAKGLSRRQFGALTGAAALAACTGEGGSETATTSSAGTQKTEFKPEGSMVDITTADGTMDAYFVKANGGKGAGVILWPDIASLRPSKRQMADLLAKRGYSVIVANPYYRDVPADQFESSVQFREVGGFEKVGPWRDKLTSEAVMRDADALVGWLDEQEAVETAMGIGTQGYCMGGPFTVYTAHARPERVKAAASFHGGGLVREDEDSPHKILEKATQYLFAIAKNDDAKAPGDKTELREAALGTGVVAEIEVYDGDHGWTVQDNPAYAEGPAEKAWERLLVLYDKALTV